MQKTVLLVLPGIVIGALPIAAILAAGQPVHRNLANAPGRRKPHVTYAVKRPFGAGCVEAESPQTLNPATRQRLERVA